MNNYLQARQWLKSQISFEQFQKRLPSSLKESGLLSLLIGATMEQGLQPFEEYFQLLVRHGADINYCQYQSKTVLNGVKMSLLMFACKKTKTNIVKSFLKFSNLQVYHRDQNGRNAVHYAIQNPDEFEAQEIVKQLVEKYPLLKDMGNYSKGNYITIAIREGKSTLLQVLIDQQIDPHFRSLQGLGPLHEAVRAHKSHKNKDKTSQMLRILLNAGCQEQQKNNEGQTYMNYAREKGYLHEQDIDEILQEMISSTTPKQTIQTCPEQKQNEIFSIESGQIHQDNDSSQQSQIAQQPEQDINHEQLSNEMFFWAADVDNERIRVWNIVSPFYQKVKCLVHNFYGSIEAIGSFASQLWIPSSDLDFLIIIPEGTIQIFEEILDNLYRKIALLGYHNSIRVIRTYKLPLIKLVLTPQYQKLQIELFLSSKNNIASKYVTFTNQVFSFYPDMSVIYYVLRKLLSVRKMHDHRAGGLKAYALFLLIYSMRLHYQYPYVSQFVEHFCYYYGFLFEYQVQMSLNGEPQYHINIVDPLNTDNNMGGKKTDILLLQQVLQKIYLGLNTGNQGSKLSYLVDLLRFI